MVEWVHSELVLGGQRSGKSRRAEVLAAQWLAHAPTHRALMLATAQAWDEEMRERIARHRADRAQRLPRMDTLEEPRALTQAIAQHSNPQTLIVVDCLTLWLTHMLMPMQASGALEAAGVQQACEDLSQAIARAPGPVVLVSNELGWGVVPMGPEVRAFVDVQGRLNQQLAAVCERVTLMAAGLPLCLKGVA